MASVGAGLRRRVKKQESTRNFESLDDADDEIFETETQPTQCGSTTTTFWLTRVVFLRSIGFVYSVAFLIAFNQNKELVGQNGILPVSKYLELYERHLNKSIWTQLYHCPTLLWFVDRGHLNFWLDLIAAIGMMISLFVLVYGSANAVMMTLLWVLYHSLVNVGQNWYSFGWESQLLETGFLAIFFCSLFTISPFPKHSPPSFVVITGYRWLIFRIMLGAGLIKIRGDKCWRDLTCMNYHYQTQPVPNPLSYFMHQAPELFHNSETIGNHIVELFVPFLLFYPRSGRIFAGCVQIMFQFILILSGNLSFLNWLTILPSICCFDDKFLECLFSEKTKNDVQRLIHLNMLEHRKNKMNFSSKGRNLRDFLLFCLISYLSIPVVQNMLSPSQAMNRSFNPLRIVNTYGAFGSVTKIRTEVILQGTSDDPFSDKAKWLEYEFYCKPGNISRRPCVISPYHYRLDWLMWFAAFQNAESNPWFIQLISKLLQNDKSVAMLLEHNPFQDSDPPKYIRAEHYKYKFTKLGSRGAIAGNWWKRKRIGSYLQPVNLNMISGYLSARGFEVP